ncbi:Single-stranded DNA-binding protein 3 [Acipenser ruthenus]|uniref:Single-stranded DNA-binding protein 3 n=1 Tax=Acipenser ruthenus TaxID=7906 RepID=A0A662YRM8_ACIRT|nr:Single-stranded DNA-binding protein 3 [Acipenser ruthenus]
MFAKGKGSSVPSDGQARENVFWDLYCAAPERRDTCEHSSEAKAFHDYNYGGGMRPPPNSIGPGMPGINMGPGAGRPWPNPNNANSIPYSSSSPGAYVGPPGGGGPPGTPIMPSPADSTNSSDNIYTMINAVPPGGNRTNFPMGPGSDGPMGGMGGMEPHHMNGSLGKPSLRVRNSPNNISGISNPPGTPRDDGELGGNFLHSFQNDNYSPSMTMSV